MKFILETDTHITDDAVRRLEEKFTERLKTSDVIVLTGGIRLAAIIRHEGEHEVVFGGASHVER